MTDPKRRQHSSIIEAAIKKKGSRYSPSSARTLRSDALAILESLVSDLDDGALIEDMAKQGFKFSESYLTTLHALAEVARSRRPA